MRVKTEITSNVWKILVCVGDVVVEGQELMILESMKMEIPVESPRDGLVKAILVKEGQAINDGQEVLELE